MKTRERKTPLTPATLPPAQRKVYNLFMEGGMYSAADISIRLHVCDPRGIGLRFPIFG